MVGNKTKRVDLFHKDVCWDFVEMDELQKITNNLLEIGVRLIVTMLFGPHEPRLSEIDKK